MSEILLAAKIGTLKVEINIRLFFFFPFPFPRHLYATQHFEKPEIAKLDKLGIYLFKFYGNFFCVKKKTWDFSLSARACKKGVLSFEISKIGV